MEKLVSIVLPVYNGERYMRDSIDSVIAQTWKNWELIIVDDCSTDRTEEIAQEYVQKDDRIRYFRNERNLRLPRNLNRGFSFACGDYLTWTSDDNLFFPEAIKTMVLTMERTHSDFVFASYLIIDSDGQEIGKIIVESNSAHMIPATNVVGACFLYSKDVYNHVGEYDPELAMVEDFDYWQRVAMKYHLVGISEVLYKYRMHPDSLTGKMQKESLYPNLEKALLKNRKGFGRFDYQQNYFYYKNLDNCRRQMKDAVNPYRVRCIWYSFLYLCLYRVPGKVKRVLRNT